MRTVFALLMTVILSACVPSDEGGGGVDLHGFQRITGGEEVQVQKGATRAAVMITLDDEFGQSFVCTGTIISDRTVLTASHCATSETGRMRMLFGAAPFRGRYVNLPITEVRVYHSILGDDAQVSVHDRHDIALIHFSGGLPEGARAARLVLPTDLPALRAGADGISFTSMGFGRVHGRLDADDDGEPGILRRATLTSKDFDPARPAFLVAQNTTEQGACYGDSGGPAYIAAVDEDGEDNAWVFAVASGVKTLNGELADAPGIDACRHQSVYMNLAPYAAWIRREDPEARFAPLPH